MADSIKAFDPTKPVQTRDGRKARIICSDRQGQGVSPLIALVMCDSGIEGLNWYNLDGSRFFRSTMLPSIDLVNVPVKTSTWQNVYRSHTPSNSYAYRNKDEAMLASKLRQEIIGHLRRDFIGGVFSSAEFEPIEPI